MTRTEAIEAIMKADGELALAYGWQETAAPRDCMREPAEAFIGDMSDDEATAAANTLIAEMKAEIAELNS